MSSDDTKRSTSPTTCGRCGGAATIPDRFANGNAPASMVRELEGLYNVCYMCGAECTGLDARGIDARWFWTSQREAEADRAALQEVLDSAVDIFEEDTAARIWGRGGKARRREN